MSDYGVFEASSTDGHEEEQRQRQATRDLGRAIEAAREGFGDFLSGATDKQDYSDRLALVMNDLMQKVADSGVMPVPGVMRKVKAALRPEFRQAAPQTISDADKAKMIPAGSSEIPQSAVALALEGGERVYGLSPSGSEILSINNADTDAQFYWVAGGGSMWDVSANHRKQAGTTGEGEEVDLSSPSSLSDEDLIYWASSTSGSYISDSESDAIQDEVEARGLSQQVRDVQGYKVDWTPSGKHNYFGNRNHSHTSAGKFQPGDKVMRSGYLGTIQNEYLPGMYEIRLESGDAVVSEDELTKVSSRKQSAKIEDLREGQQVWVSDRKGRIDEINGGQVTVAFPGAGVDFFSAGQISTVPVTTQTASRKQADSRRLAFKPGDTVHFVRDSGYVENDSSGKVIAFPAVDPDGNVHDEEAEVEWDDGSFDIVSIDNLTTKGTIASHKHADASYEGWSAEVIYDEDGYEHAETTTPSGESADSIYPMDGERFEGGELKEALEELAREWGDDAYSGTYQYNSNRKQADARSDAINFIIYLQGGGYRMPKDAGHPGQGGAIDDELYDYFRGDQGKISEVSQFLQDNWDFYAYGIGGSRKKAVWIDGFDGEPGYELTAEGVWEDFKGWARSQGETPHWGIWDAFLDQYPEGDFVDETLDAQITEKMYQTEKAAPWRGLGSRKQAGPAQEAEERDAWNRNSDVQEYLDWAEQNQADSLDINSLDIYNGDDEISQDAYNDIYDYIEWAGGRVSSRKQAAEWNTQSKDYWGYYGNDFEYTIETGMFGGIEWSAKNLLTGEGDYGSASSFKDAEDLIEDFISGRTSSRKQAVQWRFDDMGMGDLGWESWWTVPEESAEASNGTTGMVVEDATGQGGYNWSVLDNPNLDQLQSGNAPTVEQAKADAEQAMSRYAKIN